MDKEIKNRVTPAVSIKIQELSFLAILAVFVGHCSCGSRLEVLIRPWLVWHVPWFFMISGYFFVASLEKYSSLTVLKKKFYTLLIPYLLWCCIGVLLWNYDFLDKGGTLLGVWGIGKSIFPEGNWPLWYTRALIIFMSIGIAIWSVRRFHPFDTVFFLLYCGAIAGICFGLSRLGIGVSPGSGILSFLLGSAISYFHFPVDLSIAKKFKCAGSFLSFIGAILWRLFVPSHRLSYMFILLMILGFWLALDLVRINKRSRVFTFLSLTPVVYFSHGPIIFAWNRYIQVFFKFEEHSYAWEVYYIFKCCLLFLMLVIALYFLKRCLPKAYSLMSGNR